MQNGYNIHFNQNFSSELETPQSIFCQPSHDQETCMTMSHHYTPQTTWRNDHDIFYKKINGLRRSPDEESNSSSDDSASDGIGSINKIEKAIKKVQLQRLRSASSDASGVRTDIRFLTLGPVHGDLGRRRKLIIHLDIRNTILVADSVTDVFVEEVNIIYSIVSFDQISNLCMQKLWGYFCLF